MIRNWIGKLEISQSREISALFLFILLVLFNSLSNSSGNVQAMDAPAKMQGEVYYVAPSGNDANPGTQSRPWKTIQKAAETLLAGDIVYIRAGTYNEQVIPQNSGVASNPITYAAYPGETPILDGENVILQDDLVGLFEIGWQNYIKVSGLRVINAGPYNDNAGIMVIQSSDITIENVSTDHTRSSGIGVWDSQRVTVQGNFIDQAGLSGWQECITIAGSSDFVVRDNTVVNCEKEGICLKDGASDGKAYNNRVSFPRRVGIYVDASDAYTHDIDVYSNVVHHSIESTGFSIASEVGGQLNNIRLYNNVAYNNFTYGIEISRCCPESLTHPMDSISLINNTLVNNGNGVDWGAGIAADNPQAQNVVIRNNIVSQNLTFQIGVSTDIPITYVTVDHNLIDGYMGYEGEVHGDDYVEGNPVFVDPSKANFHLQLASPAVDAGSGLDAPTYDFDGNPRPLDGNNDGIAIHDIGADEVVSYSVQVYLPVIVITR